MARAPQSGTGVRARFAARAASPAAGAPRAPGGASPGAGPAPQAASPRGTPEGLGPGHNDGSRPEGPGPGHNNGSRPEGPGPGHNNGPTLEGGTSWRRFAWGRARADLLPVLPVEVVRLRVRRAEELGLPYRTYAGVRAASGRDVIGFLFSSNALRLLRAGDAVPPDRAARLGALRGCDRVVLAHRPLRPEALADGVLIDAAAPAPGFADSWSAMRDVVTQAIGARRRPADGYLVIGETAFERDWAEAARTAGYLPAETYFAAPR